MLEVKTPEEVLRLIEKEFSPIDRRETVPLPEALGRVLAEDVHAAEYVPDFDRSTVDGYACRAADTFGCSDAIPAILSVAGQVLMGLLRLHDTTANDSRLYSKYNLLRAPNP